MTPARIMIVEDERITAEDLQDILTELGYSVTAVVSSGVEALRQAERTSPDLVLMDIRIEGEMDGTETARELRQRLNIPVVYLTAHADPDTLGRARIAEPLGYLVKPFQESELLASIEMALHKHRSDQAAREREERLAATLDVIGEGIIAVDSACRITYMNPEAEKWTGWHHRDAVGKHLEGVFQLDSADSAPVEKALRDGDVGALVKGSRLIDADGASRPIGGSVAPVRDQEGSISGALLVFGWEEKEASASSAGKGPRAPSAEPAEAGEVNIVAESPVMRTLLQFARRVAASEVSTILLEGESGTGKDVLAKFIHHQSRRTAEPFIAINCAAIPETLLESELFGYEKGAFTDARTQKKGILEVAHGGTVLLDEVSELPLPLQAKLLRVLEEQSFRRLGGVKDIRVDLRLIAATNRPLREAVQDAKFRLDLYYRLNVMPINVPPLREHAEDIVPLANHFIAIYNRRFRLDVQGIAPETAGTLLKHDWPGNVRELRNTIERAMVLEETQWLRPSSLGAGMDKPLAQSGSESKARVLEGMSLEEAEKTMLIQALEKTRGNQTRAARLLGITRDTIRYKIKKFNLQSIGTSTTAE